MKRNKSVGGNMLGLLFTLGLLAAIVAYVYPNYMRGVSRRSLISCKSNLKNIGTALDMYSADWKGNYPASMALLTPNYLKTLPTCASTGKDTYSATYQLESKPSISVRCPEHGRPEDPANKDKEPGPCKDIALKLQEQLKKQDEIPKDLSQFVQELSHCPSGPLFEHVYNSQDYWISCGGPNHISSVTPANFPQYNMLRGLVETPNQRS